MRKTGNEVTTEINLAREALARGDVSTSNQIIASLLESNADNAEVHFAQAMILMAQARHVDALASIEEALRLSPNNPDLLAWGALTCLNLSLGSKAESFASPLVQL